MNKGWKKVRLGDVVTLNYGKALISNNRIHGLIPVYSSAGNTGYHNKPLVESAGIIIGRKGTVGTVYYSPSSFFCIDTAYYVLPSKEYDLKYMYYRLCSLLSFLFSFSEPLNKRSSRREGLFFPSRGGAEDAELLFAIHLLSNL